MYRGFTLWAFTILLLVSAAGAATVGSSTASGAPASDAVVAVPPATPFVSTGGEDDGRPATEAVVAPGVGDFTSEAQSEPEFEVSGMTASRFLADLPADKQAGASIELEVARGLDTATMGRVSSAEAAWAVGRFEDAIDTVRALESEGVKVNVAVSYMNAPEFEGPTLGSNVMITASVVGETATDTAVDVDRHTGNLFALGRAPGNFSVYRSTNGGRTWAETDSWCCNPGAVDLSLVATWGYILYDVPADTELRLRRFYGTTGLLDNTYFWESVLDYTGVTVSEVDSAANPDDFDNRIYLAAALSDGTIAWWWVDATVATVFNRSDLSVTFFGGGLSSTYVNGYTSSPYLFLSFRSASDNLWVFTRGATWDGGALLESGLYASSGTSISAYEDTLLVGYTQTVTDGTGAYYRISYDSGGAWSSGTLFSPTAGGDFFHPRVSARSGTGTAAIGQEELGPFDNLVFKQRHNYESGTWSAIQPLNDIDFLTGTHSIDFEYLYTGWGFTYVSQASGAIWFTLSRDIFYSGFERGSSADWTPTVLP
jgi:hypothetical protein